jgi:hypothetical protein
MAHNRRKKKMRVNGGKHAWQGAFPGTLFGALLVLTVLSLGYLHLDERGNALGRKIKELEVSREQLRREIVQEELNWSTLTTPERMQELLKKHDLNMIWPSEDSVIRVRRNPLPQLYAQNPDASEIAHD